MLKKCALLLFIVILLSACTIVSNDNEGLQRPPQTQLEIREYQTRQFDTNNVKLIMKAVVNVLQDDGFIVKNAVVDLGIISATKEVNLEEEKSSGSFWGSFLGALANSSRNQSSSRDEKLYNKIKIVEANVNISEYGKSCKVRASFQAKILDNKGNPTDVRTVDDMKFYQDFFSKVDKGVFLQKQGF